MNIEVKNLSFSYERGNEKSYSKSRKNAASKDDQKNVSKEALKDAAKEVLKDVSLSFSDEKPTVLLSPSGSGKTTLLRILCGFLKPDSGEITGLGKDEKISVVFQEDRLFDTMNIYENWRIADPGLSEAEAKQLASELDLAEEVLKEKPATLSGGMRRRAAVGRALLYPARVVLMDEPFQGLDEETRARVIRTVRERCRGKALLVITHDPEDAGLLGADICRL